MTKEDRWHDFAKEKPSEDMEGRNFIVSNGHYEKIATWCGYWENEPFIGDRLCDEVVRWKFYFTPEEEKANEVTCKELKAIKQGSVELGEYWVYDADDVDALLAEKDKEIARLEAMRKVHVEAIASMEDRLHQDEKKIRRLCLALWIARADRAMMTLDYFTLKCRWFKDYMKVEPPGCDVKMVHKWANVESKCRAKAEEYK